MSGVTVADAIGAVITLRDKKAAIEAATKDQVASIKAKIDKLEAYLKAEADSQGVSSFKTPQGTAFLTTSDYANVADWTTVLEFIQERGAYDLLEKRVNKAAVRVYMDELQCVPPGINYGTTLGINVRRPTATKD